MVSEDSQDIGWFAMVHRLGDLCDVADTPYGKVPAHRHELDDPCELLEVQ